MSTIHPQGTPIVPEPQDERLPVGTIAIIAGISLSVFAVGVVWATMILHQTRHEVVGDAGMRPAPYVGRPEIGMVDQVVFNAEHRAAQLRSDKRERLHGAGWASRRDNLVHIPVEDAMRAIAQGARPGPVAPPSPEPIKDAPSNGPVMNPKRTGMPPAPAAPQGEPSDAQNPGAPTP